MKEKKTKEEILEDIEQEMENCCANVFHNLQANEVTLKDAEILHLADKFYTILHRQNDKVIVTGDGKRVH